MKQIYIQGNNGSGKTLFSYFLALKLASAGNKSAIISTSANAPDIPYLLPECEDNKSLGRLLSYAVIDKRDIYRHMWTFKRNENIGLFCYSIGETDASYPEITQTNITSLFTFLRNTVDYIIIDASNENNLLDKYSKDSADLILCLTTANMKGVAYRKSHDIADERVAHVLYQNSPLNPYDDIRATFPIRINYEMPYCKQLAMLYNGTSLDDIELPRQYSKFLYKLVKELIANDDKTSANAG